MTSAVGVAIGLGRIGVAIIGVVFAWIVLAAVGYLRPEPPNE
jgi:uncharacterized membrane protein YhiD involved in acid resistance